MLDALAKGSTLASSQKNVQKAFLTIKAGIEAAAKRGETIVDGVRRIPVEGLTEGNKDDDFGASKESASGRAIVLIPLSVSPSLATNPPPAVEVLLHLHGRGIGYRKPSSGPARDEAIDKIEAQLSASGRKMIAVLPQGVSMAKEKSAFGSDPSGFNSNTYLDQVFAKLTAMGIWPKAPPIKQVVLSAHSAGGFSLTQG